ncbi:MAG TPA: sulfatase-like hydrolase/transferase, partial [Mycobacteriales bacterium]|nr:sulfatase-like hydrolase/transferase [Mycobacteriales bacterium]
MQGYDRPARPRIPGERTPLRTPPLPTPPRPTLPRWTLPRRTFVGGAALLTATGCVAESIHPQPPGHAPANVLIFKSDEHNPFITSVMGHPFIRTPNLDRLARRGTVYESCYCPSPLCSPSRSSWFNGRPAHATHIYDNSKVLPFPALPTYGAVLDRQGVDSIFFGKVDAWEPPEDMGFTQMRGRIFRDPRREFEVNRNAAFIRRGLPIPVLPAAGRAKGVGEVGSVRDAFGIAVTDIERAVHFLHSR